MANSSGRVNAADEFTGRVEHHQSNVTYRIQRESNTLRLDWGVQSVPLAFFIGSRRMGRSYAFLDQGYMYQAPVGYYANKRVWDMAPGYASDRHPDLDRPITADCLYCHASNAHAEPGTANRIANWTELHGITCDRCHGDGTLHAAKPNRNNIINPARLPSQKRSAVCEQCHLAGSARVVLPGKSLDQYRPGDTLSDFLEVFLDRSDSGVHVTGHSEALVRSRCAQSGELWCGSCHNPHKPVNVNATCISCHQPESCKSSAKTKEDCAGCHMPKARAHDGGHTVFTDHSIPRRGNSSAQDDGPLVREIRVHLTPFYSRKLPRATAERNLGLAYASQGDLETAWPLLRSAAQSKMRDARLYSQVAGLLEADKRFDQAIDFYRLALEMDAESDSAVSGLARTLMANGDNQEACRMAQKSLKRNPRQPGMRDICGDRR